MNSIKCICILFLISCSSQLHTDERIVKIDELLSGLHSENSFNGNVLIAEGGNILYEKSFGLANIESGVGLDTSSIFNIASISKTFTALSILQLEEQGRLQLGDDIARYLPDFPYRGITLENLLTHTSGLYRIQSELIRVRINEKGLNNNQVLQVYSEVKPKQYFRPGEGYTYANTNYILLALVVENISKLPFEKYIDQHIFQKAGMTTSFLKKRRIPSKLQSHVVSYYRKSKWLSAKMEDISTLTDDLSEQSTFRNNYGESAIYTTARDLFRYHKALQDYTLLDSSSLRRMYSPYILINGMDYEVVSNSNYPSYSGLSWSIAKDSSDGNIVYHAGGFRGGRHFYIRNTTRDQCIIMLTNNDLTDSNTFTAPMKILNNRSFSLDKKSLPRIFSEKYTNHGIDSALTIFSRLKEDDTYIQFVDWDYEEIGQELIEKKDYNSAISLFKLYVEDYPGDEFSWSLLGDAYYFNENANRALENYHKSLTINPDNEHVHKMIQMLQ